jgi:hypothetical protein
MPDELMTVPPRFASYHQRPIFMATVAPGGAVSPTPVRWLFWTCCIR